MRVDIITLFPGMFEGVLAESILRLAREKGRLEVRLTDLRDFAADRHRTVDDRPFGGGPGMVLKVEPLAAAVRSVQAQVPGRPGRLLLFCPRGRRLEQAWARELSREERLVLIAPHYEGYDERVVELLAPERVSIGDYVLTGGELPAMVLLDAVTRLLPGVLGDAESPARDSFSPAVSGGLGFPQYTRPAEFEGRVAPEVLRSGDHAAIAAWRREAALRETRRARPDLLGEAEDSRRAGELM